MEKGCGCIVVCAILLIVGSCFTGIFQAEKENREARKEHEAQEEAARQREQAAEREKEEQKRKLLEREDKLRSFTLKEAPVLWSAYQNLQSEVKIQNQKLEELRKTLKDFNRDPESDADFKRICAIRDDMVGSLKTMRTKMEDAYLASRKYQATPSRKDYDALRRKLLEDGIQEAESAARRFKEMSRNK